jgi:hypothetical protein
MSLAIALVFGSGLSAFAFDCLTSKPSGARGHWHTQSVAGKICWFGADWRSFLAKEKAQAEPAAQAEPSPATKSEPQPADDATPSPPVTTDAEPSQDPPGLRPATPAEAAALINSISLELEPAPPPTLPRNPEPPKAPPSAHAQSDGMSDWLIAFGELAIIGGVLATLFKQFRRRRVAKAQQQPQPLPINLPFAPPLQPTASEYGQPPRRPPWAPAMSPERSEELDSA